MPLVEESNYRAPWICRNRHLSTILGSFLPSSAGPYDRRERISTPDGDFLDLDWKNAEFVVAPERRVVVICHGLEGSSHSHHIRSLANEFAQRGWDALAMNSRGCSGEINRGKRLYHSGATDDLAVVLKHVSTLARYHSICLCGFSLGANLVLKYLGEASLDGALPKVSRAAVVAAPCDLAGAAQELSRPSNLLYTWHFLRQLLAKIRQKALQFPDWIDLGAAKRIRTIIDYDEAYTAPLHGFRSADDYYRRCSSAGFLEPIDVPTLIINPSDDPFLSPACYPVELSARHPFVWLERPRRGGHVGLLQFSGRSWRWHDGRMIEFLSQPKASPA